MSEINSNKCKKYLFRDLTNLFLFVISIIIACSSTMAQDDICSNWGDVISKYNSYVSSQATWEEVIICYQEYVENGLIFNAGGRITDTDGKGIPEVTMSFSRISGTGEVPFASHTNLKGYWTQSGFQSDTTYQVTPYKTNYTFAPPFRSFSSEDNNLDFTGTYTCVDQCVYSGSIETTDGLSVERTGCYADVWTFTVSSSKEIQIGVFPSFSGWLILYSGSMPSSSGYITYSGYSDDLWITKELNPGTYCIEVTTYSQGITGTYQIISSEELVL